MIQLRRKVFEGILSSRLVYNQCWEDPALDQSALQIGPGDRVVTITSAGCNALNYLFFDSERIDAVDLNPNQTALLELKLAAIRKLRHDEFFAMFGFGRIARHRSIYGQRLRPLLSITSRAIWDLRIDYFDIRGPGLYFSGLAGTFARAVNFYVDSRRGMRQDLAHFQTIDDLQYQAEFYRARIAPRLWSPLMRWMLDRKSTMIMLGVPDEQIREMRRSGVGSLAAFIEHRLDHVFTQVPIRTNYFWRVYFNGRYSPDCCPPYLKAENFDTLRARVDRIHPHTMTLSDFLRYASGRFNVYILLDHMDWMRGNPSMLSEEWRLILQTSAPAARIIFRSGALAFEVPDFARESLAFHSDVARSLHRQDRVGTYGSFYFATLGAS